MFRVDSYQKLLRILLVSAAFVAVSAFAQDQSAQPAPKAGSEQKAADPASNQPASSEQSSDQSAKDAAASAQAQPSDAVDPLKRAPNAKQKQKNQRALKIELSK